MSSKNNLNPKTRHYEFGGPVGALFISLSLPLTIFFLHLVSTKDFKLTLTNFHQVPQVLYKEIKGFTDFFSISSILVVLGWFGLNVILERLLFAQKVGGVKLRNGKKLFYNVSGHLQFWVITLIILHGNISYNADSRITGFQHIDLSFLYDDYLKLALAAIIFSFMFSLFLYIKSFAPGALLALGGNSGNSLYDFFIGRELNPRFGSFDLKQFCELRPGLIGWAVINLGCAMKQYNLLGYVSYEMFLVNIFQGLYVWDALYHEKAILTTMDITTDGFGLMLVLGDLAWVPFTYSLQARYLVENSSTGALSTQLPFLGLVTLINCVGYFIFRSANSEKDSFRTDPNGDSVKHLRYIKTSSGRKLLVSGWWGRARKINYTGDWLMGLSWSLLTGFSTPVTYFYPIYFFILLVHRAYRDDHACSEKYGPDWPKYKKKVPYVFIPGVI